MPDVSYADIAEEIPPLDRPLLDRLQSVDELRPWPWSPYRRELTEWWRDGVVHLPNFLPRGLIDEYCALRQQFNDPRGWTCPNPYMYYREIRNICLYPPLMKLMKALIGQPMGLHLNLTCLVSTERALHADDYLNPAFVNSHYCAA